jgi:hypothetical protein
MPRKKKLVLPIAVCDVAGCGRDAAYGFRERIYVTSNDSPVSEFIMGCVPNWCKAHDAEQRPLYATKRGDYIKFKQLELS